MMNKFLFAVALLSFLGMTKAFSQTQTEQKKVEFNVGADLASRYIWRGSQFGGNSPVIQPSVSLGIKGFELGAWGSYTLSGDNRSQEMDLYLSYTCPSNMFTATVTDYYFPVEGQDYKYFDYKKNSTGHIFEGSLSFNGTEKFPVTILAAMNFYGADAISLNSDNTKKGIQYSTYFELGYSFNVNDIALNTFVGFTPNTPETANAATGFVGETGFYGSKAGIVNLGLTGSKELKITDSFTLPISASVITNPQAEKIYFVLGISL